MPRSNRYIVAGHTYHVTHRCHNRSFLLKFARDRTAYLKLMREQARRLKISLLNFNITCNHVHVLTRPSDPQTLSRFMQFIAGELALEYNRRKRRSGAFWEGRFHTTMIEDGSHLWNCMVYVDLNMVRARKVSHPREWGWSGYRELIGLRQRYRLLDTEQLVGLTRLPDLASFRANYEAAIDKVVGKPVSRTRQPIWTESIAVGSETFVNSVKSQVTYRRHVEVVPLEIPLWEDSYVLREVPLAWD